jgi:hypothetical protein
MLLNSGLKDVPELKDGLSKWPIKSFRFLRIRFERPSDQIQKNGRLRLKNGNIANNDS